MIEALLELVVQIVVQIIGEVVFEFLVTLGWESFGDTLKPQRRESKVWEYMACLLVGLLIGTISILVVGHRVAPQSPWPGASLVLAPIGTGLVMRRLGDVWEERGKARPILFSFRAGGIFAFGIALARFVYIESLWRPF